MSVTPLFDEHPRVYRPETAIRAAAHLGSMVYGVQRKSDKVSIDEQVKKSLDSIERVVENYSALQDNIHNLREIAERTGRDLTAQKEVNAQVTKQLSNAQAKINELQSLLSNEQLRLRDAQTTIAAMEKVVSELEEENSSTRTHALRLVQGVEILMAAENNIHLRKDLLAQRR